MADIEIRPVAFEERRAAIDALRAALLDQPIADEGFDGGHDSWEDSDALAAWDGGRCVGNAAAFRLRMTVPGGARPATAGVTRVGVLPTHTRRGLLRRMMERLLREANERGQVIAALLASEAPIYGRFGYGLATDDVAVQVTTATARPLRGEPVGGSIRTVARADLDAVIPDLYDRCAQRRAGMVTRAPWIWRSELTNVENPAAEHPNRGEFVAVHTDENGVDDGYVRYQVGWDDEFGEVPRASGVVHDLVGTTPTAERALWAYLLDVDLVRTWTAEKRPANDPIRRAFHDLRAYATKRRIDELWVRLLDVDAALGARAYGPAAGAVVVAIDDPMFEHNRGTWRISADGAARTDEPADVAVDIATASAAYLGGVPWRDLADSGEVRGEVDRGTLDRLDALFAVHPTPFCGTDF